MAEKGVESCTTPVLLTEREHLVGRRVSSDISPGASELRAWRSGDGRKHGVPAYLVINDATLEGIATTLPRNYAQ
ncbi:HRDC domain-containing protein [Nitrobacter winogradskyi]|uniref:Superfamily II DNA helicase RecQ n=2 Tax=Nitrobacter winogradskyi TaxID=913 RepID=A0ACC6AN91_NITWI|nr:HRDC domain-containing protein [Nitrobacter winogradskyi]MCP2001248.1 superfamily II DNA helicase RecQ [Nitrobacter winogradskyi]GEC17554.1 hypothetical protein NWI01_34460 [Nitrobacter winogradskyi]